MIRLRFFLSLFAATLSIIAASAQSKPKYETTTPSVTQRCRISLFPELVAGADPARKLDIAMMVWLVRGNGKNILVDSGFYHDRFFKDWHVFDLN